MNDRVSDKRRTRAATGVSRYILTVEDESGAVLRVERESAGGVDELPVEEVLSRIHGPTGTGRDPGELAKAPGALSRRLWRILPPPTTVKPPKDPLRRHKNKLSP